MLNAISIQLVFKFKYSTNDPVRLQKQIDNYFELMSIDAINT